jgi:hypothetical protein
LNSILSHPFIFNPPKKQVTKWRSERNNKQQQHTQPEKKKQFLSWFAVQWTYLLSTTAPSEINEEPQPITSPHTNTHFSVFGLIAFVYRADLHQSYIIEVISITIRLFSFSLSISHSLHQQDNTVKILFRLGSIVRPSIYLVDAHVWGPPLITLYPAWSEILYRIDCAGKAFCCRLQCMISPPPPSLFSLDWIRRWSVLHLLHRFILRVFICWPASDAEVGKKERASREHTLLYV